MKKLTIAGAVRQEKERRVEPIRWRLRQSSASRAFELMRPEMDDVVWFEEFAMTYVRHARKAS